MHNILSSPISQGLIYMNRNMGFTVSAHW